MDDLRSSIGCVGVLAVVLAVIFLIAWLPEAATRRDNAAAAKVQAVTAQRHQESEDRQQEAYTRQDIFERRYLLLVATVTGAAAWPTLALGAVALGLLVVLAWMVRDMRRRPV